MTQAPIIRLLAISLALLPLALPVDTRELRPDLLQHPGWIDRVTVEDGLDFLDQGEPLPTEITRTADIRTPRQTHPAIPAGNHHLGRQQSVTLLKI